MKSLRLNIDRCNVSYSTTDPSLRQIIRSRISDDFFVETKVPADVSVRFGMSRVSGQRRRPLSDLYKKSNFPEGKIQVACPISPPNSSWLYHVGFLQPISVGLLRYESTLIHAGLVARQGEGTLLVGESGAGKSTLSLLFALNGYTFFTDEHAILSITKTGVKGRPFYGPVALGKKSLMHVRPFSVESAWNAHRGKYLISERFLNPASLSSTCRISKVIFPSFGPRKSLAIRELSQADSLKRLLKDEYVGLSVLSAEGGFTQSHLTLLETMVQNASCYHVSYGAKDVRKLPQTIGELP